MRVCAGVKTREDRKRDLDQILFYLHAKHSHVTYTLNGIIYLSYIRIRQVTLPSLALVATCWEIDEDKTLGNLLPMGHEHSTQINLTSPSTQDLKTSSLWNSLSYILLNLSISTQCETSPFILVLQQSSPLV